MNTYSINLISKVLSSNNVQYQCTSCVCEYCKCNISITHMTPSRLAFSATLNLLPFLFPLCISISFLPTEGAQTIRAYCINLCWLQRATLYYPIPPVESLFFLACFIRFVFSKLHFVWYGSRSPVENRNKNALLYPFNPLHHITLAIRNFVYSVREPLTSGRSVCTWKR